MTWLPKESFDAMKEWNERTERIAIGWATKEDLKWKEGQDRKHTELKINRQKQP